MGKKTVAIIHFNTPELTEAAICSLRKQTGNRYDVVVFDNSDKRPFSIHNSQLTIHNGLEGVKVIDNTKGKYIDFDKELAKYPDMEARLGKLSNQGSVKHILSVQKLWELIPEGFILMESDVLIIRNIDFLWDENFAASGKVQYLQRVGRKEKDRLLPFLCYMNVPKLVANGARYFDPERCWNLHKGENNPANYWDTGACLLDDIRKTKPALVCRCWPNLDHYFLHYHGGSWRHDLAGQKTWLNANSVHWFIPENKDVKIYVCTHTDFEPVVCDEHYEVIDSREKGDFFKVEKVKSGKGEKEKGKSKKGEKVKKDSDTKVPGPFYSELLHMKRVSEQKNLPKYIGFVQYRKYFSFFDDLPDIPAIIEKYGMITPTPVDIGMPMRTQWGSWGNIEDLDLATEIVNEKHPELAKVWNANLQKRTMHPGSLHIMKVEEWKEMVAVAWDIVNEWLKRIGGDIDKRIDANPEKYHIGQYDFTDQANERRVGGNICERIVSAWADWKHPNAAQFPLKITSEKIAPSFER